MTQNTIRLSDIPTTHDLKGFPNIPVKRFSVAGLSGFVYADYLQDAKRTPIFVVTSDGYPLKRAYKVTLHYDLERSKAMELRGTLVSRSTDEIRGTKKLDDLDLEVELV